MENVNCVKEVIETLRKLGVPANLKGYEYIKYALQLVVNDRSKLDGITKVLYPEVAKEFETTPARAERNIRHAIEVVFDHSGADAIKDFFGGCVNIRSGKVTNGEFIGIVAEHIRVQLGMYDRQ